MRCLLLVSTGLLLACAETVQRSERSNGVFVQSGAAEFAVFTQGDTALAIFVGATAAPNETWVISAAQSAIEQITGCPVVRDSVETHDKTVAARIDCARSTDFFLRSNTAQRGRTSRSGLGASQEQLLVLSDSPETATQ